MSASDQIETFGERTVHATGTWLIATAVIFILLGLAAIAAPLFASLAFAMLVGWLMLAAGMTHVISVMRSDGGGAVWHIAVGLFYVAAGAYFLMHPLMTLTALTLLLSIVLFVEAGVDLVAYSAQRKEAGSIWLIVNALMTAALGTLIALHWPSISAWAIGTIVGVNLFTTGLSRLMLGSAARSFGRRVSA